MTPEFLIVLVLLFQFKHLLADWVWQSGWMVRNKAAWGHPGGLAHAAMHAVLTLPILLFAGLGVFSALAVGLVEFAVHYHTDWAKANYTRSRGHTPKDKSYWVWMGIDQFAHQITYVAILFYLTKVL